MTLREKLMQLTQLSRIFFDKSDDGALTGPMQSLNLSKEDLYNTGSVLNVFGVEKMMAMQQEMVMLARMVDQARGSNIAEQLMARFTGQAPVPAVDGNNQPNAKETLGGTEGGAEASNVKKAKQRVAESTDPT